MDISKKIVELRERKGLSQRELARRVDLNPSVMNRIETGDRPLRADELKRISDALGVQVDEILGSSTKNSTKDEKDIAKRMEEIREDLTKADGLSFQGEPLSEEAVESLMEAMEHIVRQTQRINKKYIPKKYRKDEDQ
ncbi:MULTISPECIES: helix-turn-helix domain-containing protein [Cytobacillus]|uniref:helix-turn-helix domain-containing protein n=1 Tax=Cytobacillus TaxID=2675230 RepID=UPI0018CD09F7|nr:MULTISPECIES: helix-turn-helix transcriptional regulator [Cytobacillus]MBG9549289.1 immunity repressor protein [Cytobacillus firmus]MBG9604488.1 immunity repressor protein [Cytobacillus firmus]MBU8733470.1 helix-turn-helix domain-containing protein [Cytobacillus oceanisediminis]MED1939679.1 helix-turn-helix transcriptional regulator [Cytobacillus firmus]